MRQVPRSSAAILAWSGRTAPCEVAWVEGDHLELRLGDTLGPGTEATLRLPRSARPLVLPVTVKSHTPDCPAPGNHLLIVQIASRSGSLRRQLESWIGEG